MENGNKKKLLIIDDDIDIRQLVKRALEKQDYIFLEADDGIAGLEIFKSESLDMVIADVRMPGLNGFEFCEKASQCNHNKHIPIMIMTAHDDQESVNKAYKKGATDFMTKPINLAKLNHRIKFSLRAYEVSATLARSERQLLSAQKLAKLGDWVYDVKQKQFHCSDEAANIFGINDSNRMSHDDLINYISKKDASHVRKIFEEASHDNNTNNIEYSIKSSDGTSKQIRQTIDVAKDDVTNKGKIFGIFQDISDLRNAEKKVRTLSLYDSVTGLPNRQLFKRLLAKTIVSSKRYERKFALLDINLDKFIRVNTTLGHDIGDKVLIEAGQRLKSNLRDTDYLDEGEEEFQIDSGVLAHFGGDDFMILLNNINSADDAAKVASRINKAFEKSFKVAAHEIHMTISIGIGIYPDDGADAESLMKKVSAALQNAKETGRNCYRFYTDAMNAMSFQRLSMETGLRKALKREEFVLYYQPKISLLDGKINGAEALIRWKNPELGLVSPNDFIPLAESTRLIVPMTDWILAEVCRQLSVWDANGLKLESVAVNITPASLLDKNINDHVFKQLRDAGVEASRLDFEITESVFMHDFDVIVPILHEFKKMGSSISIDDFGTGYSSLTYLKRLPISTLKIDQSFIRDLLIDKDDAIIVNAVIPMSHNLGFDVVAEGVEQLEQLKYLRKHNCDVVQGYYYSRPLPADEFFEWAMEYESKLCEISPVLKSSAGL